MERTTSLTLSKRSVPSQTEDSDHIHPYSSTSSIPDTSTTSYTSTIEFHHESFVLFEPKVRKLCKMIWPPAGSEILEKRRINDRLRGFVRRLRFYPSLRIETFTVERLSGGSFNRIIGITVNEPQDPHRSEYILRIPRFDTARTDRDAAVLQYVRQRHPTIPAADVVAIDFTKNNPLDEPYMIQTRLRGKGLVSKDLNFTELTHEQQCIFASQFGQILKELFSQKRNEPGHIEIVDIPPLGDSRFHMQTFRIRPFDVDTDVSHTDPDRDEMTINGIQPEYSSSLDFFQNQFARLEAAAVKRGDFVEAGYMDAFSALAVQLDKAGFLGEHDKNVLCHRDLNMSPHNILVDIDNKGKLSITGILDWDGAVFTPAFAACTPPMWIWAWDDDRPEVESHANDVPSTSERQERKQAFEQAVGDEWLKYAYKPGYRIARKLCEFAVDGLHSSWKMDEANTMIAEWADMRLEGMERIWRPLEGDAFLIGDVDNNDEDCVKDDCLNDA